LGVALAKSVKGGRIFTIGWPCRKSVLVLGRQRWPEL
jgi:hypothetical protein